MSNFNKVPLPKIKRNWFNKSFVELTTGEMGQLIPVCFEEVLPGDTWKGSTESHVLYMPMVSPVMHRMSVKTYTFFCPTRILLGKREWENFLTGGKSGKERVILPEFNVSINQVYNDLSGYELVNKYFGVGSLFDHLGFPAQETYEELVNTSSHNFTLLPFRMYNMIWNEYFRDENLQDEIELNIDKNIDDSPLELFADILAYEPRYFSLKRKCWEKDYFSSALPFTQRGDDVYIPITGGVINNEWTNGPTVVREANEQIADDQYENLQVDTSSLVSADQRYVEVAGVPVSLDVTNSLQSSLQSVNATINDLRTAFAVQRYLETSARVGYRFKEWLLGHFGERIADSRIQRPEFLGGSTQPVVISQVLQTSSSDSVTPQGNMSGHGESLSAGNQFTYRFNEHGYIMTLVCVVPRSGYFQGLHRKFTRKDKFDFFSPEFQNLGEQAILNQEIYYDWFNDVDNSNEGVFGYQGRWNEMRSNIDHISGDIKTDAFRTWHLNRQFDKTPVLNSDFVQIGADNNSNNGLNRIFAAESTGYSHIIFQIYNHLQVKRKMSYFAIPH